MQQRVQVSVPGKLILMGEHAAVYGQPALVAAVGPRASIEVTQTTDRVAIDLPDFGSRVETEWSQISSRADSARSAWSRYADEPTPEHYAALQNDSPEHLVALALGEIAHEIGSIDLPAIRIRIASELPIGSGFGSSAATAVGVVGATLAFLGEEIDGDRIDRLALEVERRQHGHPSGIDHRTILNGGVVWARRGTSGSLEVEPIPLRSHRLNRLMVYQTGRPIESTGEVVAAVRRRRREAPAAFDRRLDRMGACVVDLRDYLCSGERSIAPLISLIRSYEGYLEEMGVVPRSIQAKIRAIEASNGGAKISGAGALSGDAGGCLLICPPDGDGSILAAELLTDYRHQAVEIGVEGFRVEERA